MAPPFCLRECASQVYLQPQGVLPPQMQFKMRMSQMMSHPPMPQKFMPPKQFKRSRIQMMSHVPHPQPFGVPFVKKFIM